MADSTLKVVSFNSTGLSKLNCTLVNNLLSDTCADILMLQETWLLKEDLHRLSSIHQDYIGRGISSVKNDVILEGRPYGGLAFLWKQSLAHCVSTFETASIRVFGLTLKDSNGKVTIILNVYMPVDERLMIQASEEFERTIAVVENVISSESYSSIIIAGDFNTDIKRNTAQTIAFMDFLMRNSLRSTWTLKADPSLSAQHTFVSNNGYKSQIDHFLVTLDCCSQVKETEVLELSVACKDVGHLPIVLKLLCSRPQGVQLNACEQLTGEKIAWHKISSFQDYKTEVNNCLLELSDLSQFDCINCEDYTCRDKAHLDQIDALCNQLTDICIQAANKTLPKVKQKKTLPKWNESIKPLKDDAKFWGDIWRQCGRPSTGVVVDIYRKCRRSYHYAIRALKKKEQTSRLDRLAECMAKSKTRDLWTELKKIRGHSKVSAPNIDGEVDPRAINSIFANKYKGLFNTLTPKFDTIIDKVKNTLIEDRTEDFKVDVDI